MQSILLFLYSTAGRAHCGSVLAFAVGMLFWAVLIHALLP